MKWISIRRNRYVSFFYMKIMLFIPLVLTVNVYGAGLSLRPKEESSILSRDVVNPIGNSGKNMRRTTVEEEYGKLPLYFIENKGQINENVIFYEKGVGRATFFTRRGVSFALMSGQQLNDHQDRYDPWSGENEISGVRTPKPEIINLVPLKANAHPNIVAEGLQQCKVNCFLGNNPEKWKTNIPTYNAIIYKNVYQNIDMKFYGNNRCLEYDIIVKPGASPSRVQLSYEGIEDAQITEEGNLEIRMKGEKFIQKKPYIYQEINGKRIEVEGRFRVANSGLRAQNKKREKGNLKQCIYGFQVASYDKRYPLVIDPTIVYSTYLGGTGNDAGSGIAVDVNGNAYITGVTYSSDFPTTNTIVGTYHDGGDAFVMKINAAGDSIVYSTYLGGSNLDRGYGIAVDASGNTYISGTTYSTDFPTINALDGTLSGTTDTFMAKISAAGDSLIYSSYLGGRSSDYSYGIAVDASGNAYITGVTSSSNFPVANAVDASYNGNGDIFVTKVNASGGSIIYSTYLGGSSQDHCYGIVLDTMGNVYITGETTSANFPVVDAIDGSLGGTKDAFVAKINAAGNGLVYSTYLGGSDNDSSDGIAIDTLGNVYITGITYSGDFPMVNAITGVYNGGGDAFVTKIDAAGHNIVYSTYLGGSGEDYGKAITVDTYGRTYVSGSTNSTNFPLINAFDGTIGGPRDIFVTKINAAGSKHVYSSYLGGGSGNEYGYGIAVDTSGSVYITGITATNGFPTVNAIDISFNGGWDAVLIKIADEQVEECLAESITNIVKVPNGGSAEIMVAVAGANDCEVEGTTVSASVSQNGQGYVSISPASQITDANGIAVFTVQANAFSGSKINISFSVDGVSNFMVVTVLVTNG